MIGRQTDWRVKAAGKNKGGRQTELDRQRETNTDRQKQTVTDTETYRDRQAQCQKDQDLKTG